MQERGHVEQMLRKQLGCDVKHQHPFWGWLLCSDDEWALGSVAQVVPIAGGKHSLWSLWSSTVQPRPRVLENLTLCNLIHKPSLLSQTGCPLGDFWGCHGSKIDNFHLKRQFSVAEEDQQHLSPLLQLNFSEDLVAVHCWLGHPMKKSHTPVCGKWMKDTQRSCFDTDVLLHLI